MKNTIKSILTLVWMLAVTGAYAQFGGGDSRGDYMAQGNGLGFLFPEINIQGNGNDIVNGSLMPALENHTNFGGALANNGAIVRTFTIQNTGTDLLTLGDDAVSVSGGQEDDFSVTVQPATTVAAGGFATFTIQFAPSEAGSRSTNVSVANDVGDESPYTFAIQGTGLLFGEPDWSAIGDYALRFDGDDDYVDCGSMNLSGSAITIESWVYANSFKPESPFISNIAGIEDIGGTALLRLGDASLANNKAQFVLDIGGQQRLDGITTLETMKWYHIAAVYDGSGMRLYINGKLDASNSQSGSFTANDNFYLSFVGGGSGGRSIDGIIDEVRVWNVARTEAEIKANMYKELTGDETGLVAYYQMSDGAGTTLTDNSGNNNIGTLVNGPQWTLSGCFAGTRQALSFNGTDQYVNLGNHESIQLSTGVMTLEAWIYPTDLGDNVWGKTITKVSHFCNLQ